MCKANVNCRHNIASVQCNYTSIHLQYYKYAVHSCACIVLKYKIRI